jgi:gliding motility-associated-like protein
VTNVTVLENVQAVAFQVQEASDQTASDGSATVTVTSGTGPFTYAWSNGSSTQTINNLSPGLYCVTVTADNGCNDVTCISVLYPGAISVDVQDGSVTCNGDTDGTLTVVISDGDAPYFYEWGTDFGAAQGSGLIMNAGQSAFINNLSPGDNYTITVTDGNGLIVVNFGEILEPLPIVNNLDTTICFGETLTVGATTYSSSGPILENLISSAGCDSLVTGTLTVLNEVSTTLNLTECFGTLVTVGNTNYTTTGPINEVLTAYNGCDSTVSGFLTILPEISTTVDTTICAGETVQTGFSVYSNSGNYTDTLPAYNGCDSLVVTNLTVLDPLTLTTSLTSEASGYGDADGMAMALPNGGSGTYTYLWGNGTTTAMANGLTGGQTYCVTVTDDIGCSEEACQIIYFPVNILSDFMNDTLDCPGDGNGSLTFTAYNGQAPYSYTWTNESGTLSGSGTINSENGASVINNLPAGMYTIEISDVWGSGSFDIKVVEPEPMDVIVVEQLDAVCFNDCNGLIEVSVTNGAAPYNFVWSDGSIGNRIENLCAGEYELLIIDANGCTTTWQGLINEPAEFVIEAIEINPVSCNGGDDGTAGLSTNGNPVSILWNTGDTTLEIQNLVADVYTVTVTNTDNCIATASIDINEPLSPIDSEITINQEITCNDAGDGAISITATGSTGFSYTWSGGLSGSVLNNLNSGTYAVTITDEQGCETFNEIILVEPEPISAEISSIDVNCFDGEDSGIILIDTVTGGVGDYVASLDGESFYTVNQFGNLEADSYDIHIQDANGCTEIFPVGVASPGEIMVDLGDDLMIDLGETVTLDALTSSQNPLFIWSVDSLSCIYCPSIEFIPLNANRYSVTVTDEISGCSASDDIIVNVSKERVVFLPNIFTPNGDGQNDVFNVFAGPSVALINNFRVFNRWGETVYAAENFLPGTNSGWNGELDGKRAPDGVYVYYLDVEFIDGRMERFKGDVTLIK